MGGVIVEGVETSLDQTLQSDFHEAAPTPLTDAGTGGLGGSQQSVCEKTQDNSETAVVDDMKVVKSDNISIEQRNERNEDHANVKKEIACSGEHTSSGVSVYGTSKSDPSSIASEKLGAGKGSSFKDESAERDEKMETAPFSSGESDSVRVNLDVHGQQSVLGDPAGVAGRSVDEHRRIHSAMNSNRDEIQLSESSRCDAASSSDFSTSAHRFQATTAASSGACLEHNHKNDPNISQRSILGGNTDSTHDQKASSLDKALHSVESHDQAKSQSDSDIKSAPILSESGEERASANQSSCDVLEGGSGVKGQGDTGAADMETTKVHVEALSCQELLEEEEAERMAATATQLPSGSQPTSCDDVDKQCHVTETREASEHHSQSSKQAQVSFDSKEMESNASRVALASSAMPAVQPSIYTTPPQPSSSSPSPWFSLFPRELCEAVQVAYVDNQAVLVKNSAHHAHQQQQQVQHMIATDAAGNQYIMAAPAPVGGSATQATAAAPQFAYMTADGQIIAATGQNQVIQQVTGMGYALVGNTLVQVPQTQYIAVNASGQQLVIAGRTGQQPSASQQAGVQYVALNGGNAAASGSVVSSGIVQAAAAAGGQQGQQYLAVVEREGGGQMLVQVGGSAEQQHATKQYIVQATGDPAQTNALVAAPPTQAGQPSSSNEANPAVGSSNTPQKPQYGIVNSDGSITLIDEETVACYKAAALASSKVTAENGAVVQTSSHTHALSASVGSIGAEQQKSDADQQVKVEIDVPNQYPQVYIKTEEPEEEEEREGQGVELGSGQTLESRQAAALGQSGASGQAAVVVVDQPPDQSSAVTVEEGVVRGGASIQATGSDHPNQQVATAQVRILVV